MLRPREWTYLGTIPASSERYCFFRSKRNPKRFLSSLDNPIDEGSFIDAFFTIKSPHSLTGIRFTDEFGPVKSYPTKAGGISVGCSGFSKSFVQKFFKLINKK